jgi:hypothetical protein
LPDNRIPFGPRLDFDPESHARSGFLDRDHVSIIIAGVLRRTSFNGRNPLLHFYALADTLFTGPISETEMDLPSLQITAPFTDERLGLELISRFGRLAAAYSMAAFAGAFVVFLLAFLLHVQDKLAIDIPLLRAVSAIAAVFAVGFFLGRMRRKIPH